MASREFWQRLNELVTSNPLIIDRPRGSRHPRYADMRYPYDYGYLANTISGDGQGIDVWVGSLGTREVTAVICTVDLIQRNSEIKLLVGCTEEDAKVILGLHNSGEQSAILVVHRQEMDRC